MLRKTLVATAAAAAAAIALAPLAHADDARVDVTDQFVSIDAPDAFAAKANLNLIISNYGASGKIECVESGVTLVDCAQTDVWGTRHDMQYLTNIGPRAVWVTADGWQIPQLPPMPPMPQFTLPPIGPIVIPPMPDLGSSGTGSGTGSGSNSPGLNLDIDLTSSLGGLGVGIGAGLS